MYLTYDVGTTSVKVVLYARDGRRVRRAIRSYALATPAPNLYEADPEQYWRAVVDGVRETVGSTGADPREIQSISGCSQGETLVFLGDDGLPLRPAIVWIDQRARAESDELSTLASRDELYRVTGLTDFDPMWSASKVLWVKRNQPEVFRRTARFLLVEDYITWRLTGRACTTANLLSSSLLVDVRSHRYWDRIVEHLGIEGRLAEIVQPGDLVGTLSDGAARELGLDVRTIVVKGAMDQAASAIGAGNLSPGIVTETTGSAMAIGVTGGGMDCASPLRLPFQPHIIRNALLYLPYVQTAGGAYKWWRDMFCQEEVRLAANLEEAYDRMNRLAGAVPPGAEGVVFLPFLAGAGQSENNPDARGVFYGLTLRHGKGHCARAIMESVAFMLRKIIADLVRSGVDAVEVRSMGGGARSDLWLQIKADAVGLPLVRMEEEETSTLGAAILAAVRCADYPDVASAVAAMVRCGRRFEPDPRTAGTYEHAFTLYNSLYAALVPVFREFSH